jgi:hypothetical protein
MSGVYSDGASSAGHQYQRHAYAPKLPGRPVSETAALAKATPELIESFDTLAGPLHGCQLGTVLRAALAVT